MPTERFKKLSEQKKKRVCDAVISELQRRDYGQLHMTQVARHAHISRASLYTYFRDKEDMLHFSLQQTRVSIWNHDKARLLELAGDYLAMREASLDYHLDMCRTNRLYQILYLPMETEGLPFCIHDRLPEGTYREYKSWIYGHAALEYREAYTQEEFDVFQETCNDILKISLQEYLASNLEKEDIRKTFGRKLAQLDMRGRKKVAGGERR